MPTVRFNFYLQRNWLWGYGAFGVLMIVLGVTLSEYAAFLITLGIILIIGTPLLEWVRVYLHRDNLLQEAEVTLTSEGIQRRTETYTLHVTWDMVERVQELKHMWVFIGNRRTRIALNKQRLSLEQRAELADFIAGLPQTGARR
jgi:hypothetical protein